LMKEEVALLIKEYLKKSNVRKVLLFST